MASAPITRRVSEYDREVMLTRVNRNRMRAVVSSGQTKKNSARVFRGGTWHLPQGGQTLSDAGAELEHRVHRRSGPAGLFAAHPQGHRSLWCVLVGGPGGGPLGGRRGADHQRDAVS